MLNVYFNSNFFYVLHLFIADQRRDSSVHDVDYESFDSMF